MLLLARKQFHLDLIQVYLKGRHSIFENMTGQLVVFSTIVRLGCERREDWKYQEYYRCPGPQQSSTGDMDIPLTLQCELIPAGGTDPDPASAAELQ